MLTAVWKPGGPNLTMYGKDDLDNIGINLAIESAVTIDDDSGEPMHTIVVPDFGTEEATVLECSYSGREYLADVVLDSPVSPLRITDVISQGPYLGPYVKQELTNITHSLLSGGMGGTLARGFIDSGYNSDGSNSTHLAMAIEPIFEQLGEAWFSLMRQQVERSNLYGGDQFGDLGAQARLYATVSRLGGGKFGWLAVLGVLMVGTLIGIPRSCVGRRSFEFEAQDAVKLLRSMTQDPAICDTSRARYRDGFKARCWWERRISRTDCSET